MRRLVDDELDLCQQSLDLDRLHDAVKAVAGREPLRLAAPQPRDLGGADDAAVRRVAPDLELAVAIPAPERVQRDPELACGLGGGVGTSHEPSVLHRHCLCEGASGRD